VASQISSRSHWRLISLALLLPNPFEFGSPQQNNARIFRGHFQTQRRTASPSSPLAWGDPAHVEKLLGQAFELKFEPGISDA
jgi:hypothetical protein